MDTINYIGEYSSLEALWAAYPSGGIEGDFACIGNIHYAWDKYKNQWVITNLSDNVEKGESEPVESESLKAVNYIGAFTTLSEVWKAYPEGGHSGDYIGIDGVCYLWDSANVNWVVDTEGYTTLPEDSGLLEGANDEQLNFLGKFANFSDVWYFFPEGGHNGDFILVSGRYYVWNFGSGNWVDSTDTEYVGYDFSGEAEKAIESRVTINYLGSFENVNDVWIIYPEGGHEGDYIHLSNVITIWNKYLRIWGGGYFSAIPCNRC